jgi:hypothetical protein
MPMCMQVMRATLFVITLYLTACSATPQDVPLLTGVSDCSDRLGLTGLRVYLMRDNEWEEVKSQDGKIRTSKVDYEVVKRIPRNDPDISLNLEDRYPQEPKTLQTGEVLGFPAALSPDGRRWAAAVVSKDRLSPTALVIRNGESVRRIAALPGFRIETMAWNPASTQLAVIELNYDNSSRTALDLISPHGVQYSDVVLTVYAVSGQAECQQILALKRRTPSPVIEWVQR